MPSTESGNNTLLKLGLFVLAGILIISVSVRLNSVLNESVIDRFLRYPDERVTLLDRVIEKNKITHLPASFTLSKDRIYCFSNQDRNSTQYLLIIAKYKTGVTSGEAYTFVIDGDGRCLFDGLDNQCIGVTHSGNSTYAGFYDINGDGILEKTIQFNNPNKSIEAHDSCFQVWSISLERTELLLEVKYRSWDESGLIHYEIYPDWPAAEPDSQSQSDQVSATNLAFGDRRNPPLAVFEWSSESNTYTSKNRMSDLWEMSFPFGE